MVYTFLCYKNLDTAMSDIVWSTFWDLPLLSHAIVKLPRSGDLMILTSWLESYFWINMLLIMYGLFCGRRNPIYSVSRTFKHSNLNPAIKEHWFRKIWSVTASSLVLLPVIIAKAVWNVCICHTSHRCVSSASTLSTPYAILSLPIDDDCLYISTCTCRPMWTEYWNTRCAK